MSKMSDYALMIEEAVIPYASQGLPTEEIVDLVIRENPHLDRWSIEFAANEIKCDIETYL